MTARLLRLAGLSLAGLLAASVAFAAPSGTIWNSVAVCNPNAPTNCVAPTSGGSIPVTPSAGSQVIAVDQQLLGKGDVQYALTTAVTLATAAGGSIPAGSTSVIIQPVGADIYMTRDGQDPTTSLGVKLIDSSPWLINASAAGLAAIKIYAPASTTVNLQFRGP